MQSVTSSSPKPKLRASLDSGQVWRKLARAMMRQATRKLTLVYISCYLDTDDRSGSCWRDIQEIVEKVIDSEITRSDLGEIQEIIFRVNT